MWLDHPKWSLWMLLYFFSVTLSVCVLLLFIRNEILQNVLKINFMQRPMLNFVSDVHVLGIEHFGSLDPSGNSPLPPGPLPPSSVCRGQRESGWGVRPMYSLQTKAALSTPNPDVLYWSPIPRHLCISQFKTFRLSVCLSVSLSFSFFLYYANTIQTLLHHKTGSFSPEICTATVNSSGHVNRQSLLFSVISALLLLCGCVQLTG